MRHFADSAQVAEYIALADVSRESCVLADIGSGAGPTQAILALGYSGWGPGQLEAEITQNGWLTCDGAPEIVFGSDNEAKWQAALGTLGVSALLLSSEAGHA